jgi:hypothetical protein
MSDQSLQPAAPPSQTPPPPPPAEPQIPEKFLRDGKPDIPALVNSYSELETRFLTKTEQLKAELAAEMQKDRPTDANAYTLPAIPGVEAKELAEHPMVGWWKEQAFAAGLPQDKFAAAIEAYIERTQPQPIPEETLRQQLGDNFKQRIAAVDQWAVKTAASPGEMAALKRIGEDADGIKMMERLAGLGGAAQGDTPAAAVPELTLEKLRAMQQDPRYWNPATRDADLVRQVEDGYRKLYPDAKKSA